MSGFTPGPWTILERRNMISIMGPHAAVDLKFYRHGAKRGQPVVYSKPPNVMEDALLIHASPVMYKALMRIKEFSSAMERGEEPLIDGAKEITRIALEALKVADGENE